MHKISKVFSCLLHRPWHRRQTGGTGISRFFLLWRRRNMWRSIVFGSHSKILDAQLLTTSCQLLSHCTKLGFVDLKWLFVADNHGLPRSVSTTFKTLTHSWTAGNVIRYNRLHSQNDSVVLVGKSPKECPPRYYVSCSYLLLGVASFTLHGRPSVKWQTTQTNGSPVWRLRRNSRTDCVR